jgi:hypothetical protein
MHSLRRFSDLLHTELRIILLWFRLCVEKQSEGFTPRRVKFPGPGYVTITAPLAAAVDQFTFYRAR